MEDKKCRICGHADMANQNFYNCHSKLVEKIVAVFPIVLYPSDPLPKHICKKCLVCATTMYNEIERALRNQNKWISNVRSVQPDNSYVKVVDSIEGAMKQTQKLVSKIAGEELGERAVCRMFNFKTDGGSLHHRLKNNISVCLNKPAPTPVKTKPVAELPAAANTNQSNREPSFHTVLHKPATKITQLTTVLELNGCTLTKVKPAVKPAKVIQEAEELKAPFQAQQIDIQIKEEPLYEDEKYSDYSVKCKMCFYCCETVEELAIHQLNHLTLSVTKLSERRYLDKRIRRGRLIRVAEKKCIRCLNCWRIFVDNKSILHHWSTGDCNFFCQICGKDFASSPKMLREHVLAAHGISYKSVKLLRPHTVAAKRHIKGETSSQKSELSPNKGVRGGTGTSPGDSLSVRVACNICMKVFANFKARNSHMRAHKHPPFLPAQPPPSLTDTLLAFNRNPLLPVKEEPTDFDDIPQHIVGCFDGPGPSTSKTVHAPAYGPKPALHSPIFPSPKMIQHRPKNVLVGAASPTGIRTKYVQIRPNPNAIVFKSEPGQVLKVKSLAHLQDPSVSSQQPESADKPSLHVNSTTVVSPTSNGLGVVTTPPKDNMNYGQIFNCHPCRGKFSSKLELFRHKRKCTANNLFPCQFCSRHFLTSADLQLHIMLLHHGSVTQ